MDIILSHRSAFTYWRLFPGDIKTLKHARRTGGKTGSASLPAETLSQLAALGFTPSEEHPVDLLFLASSRIKSPAVRTHSFSGELPAGSLYRLTENVLIVAPELCFTQLAEDLQFGTLALAGCELCGTYYRVPGSNELPSRPVLTDARRIRAFLDEAENIRGRRGAQTAAAYLLEKAASPMEAKLALVLSLPQNRGGFGLPAPLLNPEIALGPTAFATYPHNFCRADLYWPKAKLDLEYDGRPTHTGEMHDSDAARQTALTAEGLNVVWVTFPQLNSNACCLTLANLVAETLNIRLRFRSEKFPQRQAVLRESLGLMS